jgi:hypothetical protein
MIKLVDLKRKIAELYIYIHQIFNKHKKKKFSHKLPCFDEKSSSFALSYYFVLLYFSIRVREERER